jgi:hypothetical protein
MDENLIFTLKGRSYEMTFPRVGEYRTIEAMKQTLSMNSYGSMYRTMMVSSEEALDMVDMEAFFTVLCPKIITDLKCDSFAELGLKDYLEVKKVYKEKVLPWWKEIEQLLHPKVETKKATEDDSETE